jgi:hypothetical protein
LAISVSYTTLSLTGRAGANLLQLLVQLTARRVLQNQIHAVLPPEKTPSVRVAELRLVEVLTPG